MELNYSQNRNITPAKAIKILEKHGTKVTTEEAQTILELMYKFSKLAIQMELETLEAKFNQKGRQL
jgi:hypothetical protein